MTATKAKPRARRKVDKYDRAIKFLQKHPAQIESAWISGLSDPTAPGAVLFTSAGDSMSHGCLTMIRGGGWDAATRKLTRAIRADKRIPDNGDYITVANLPVFAEWQRRLDRELKRA